VLSHCDFDAALPPGVEGRRLAMSTALYAGRRARMMCFGPADLGDDAKAVTFPAKAPATRRTSLTRMRLSEGAYMRALFHRAFIELVDWIISRTSG
jgi:hypothetical protein